MQNSDETQSTRPQREGTPPEPKGQLDKTQPTEVAKPANPETAPQQSPAANKPKGKKRRLGRIILLGILGILLLSLLGGLGGYLQAVNERVVYQESIVGTEVADQFIMGLINFERGEYEIARQRFEYILEIDPGNEAAKEQLTAVLLEMAYNDQLPTAKPTGTVVITPTPDTRAQEDIYNQAITLRDQENWDALLEQLDSLRSQDIDYKAVELDGLYYVAYRNRGMYRIQYEGNLEGGIFDINRAELYGPLDIEARNYRDWASAYITGVSFWEVDWDQVVNYLSPLVISAPYLSDSSNFTAQDRVATAQVYVYSELLETAQYRMTVGRYCDAYDLYAEVAAYINLSDNDLSDFQEAEDQCFGVEPTAAPEETATPEP